MIRLLRWGVLLVAVALPVTGAPVEAKSEQKHPYRYSVLDMPVSLAQGTVTSPVFTVPKTKAYYLMIQVEREPFHYKEDLGCWMSVERLRNGYDPCSERFLAAQWTVRSQREPVATGTSSREADDAYTKDYIFKFLGYFRAKKNASYTAEVTFTTDGSRLDAHKPHLIVVGIGDE